MTPRLFSGPTIAKRAAETRNRSTGFDYMRIVLAVAITMYHAVGMAHGFQAQLAVADGPWNWLIMSWLAMFFALSGYLVAGSLDRTRSLVTFAGLRALRIYPALMVDTLFSALVLGTVFTTLPLSDYFASPVLHRYFWNIIGHVHFYLPGVFEDHPHTKVNGQLWTVPYELLCYLALGLLALTGIYRRRWLFLGATVLGCVVLFANDLRHEWPTVFGVTGRNLVLCFLAGACVHLFRDKVRWSPGLFAVAVGAYFAINAVPVAAYLAPLPIAYMTVYLGLTNPPKFSLLNTGDYSYGVFLYGSPIEQAVYAVLRLIWPNLEIGWWVLYPASFPLIILFAVGSWHLVEKRALAQKHLLYKLETVRWPWSKRSKEPAEPPPKTRKAA